MLHTNLHLEAMLAFLQSTQLDLFELWKRMKHIAAVEPAIGHLKNEHRLERNRLKGVGGNAINTVLAAAAMNFQKLLKACGANLPLKS